VIAFTRSIVQKFPELRKDVVRKLIEGMEGFKSGKVMRGAMWIVGEWCEGRNEIIEAFKSVRRTVGEVPILASEIRAKEEEEREKEEAEAKGEEGPKEKTITRVLPDGTYATETVYSSIDTAKKDKSRPPLRSLILGGDYYTASVLASTLTKLVFRLEEEEKDSRVLNEVKAEAMLFMTSILRVGASSFSTIPIDEDSQERILTCLASLSSITQQQPIKQIYLQDTKEAYSVMANHVEAKEKSDKEKFGEKKKVVQPDDMVTCRLLGKKGAGGIVDEVRSDF
jgi:coatomer subunit beta